VPSSDEDKTVPVYHQVRLNGKKLKKVVEVKQTTSLTGLVLVGKGGRAL